MTWNIFPFQPPPAFILLSSFALHLIPLRIRIFSYILYIPHPTMPTSQPLQLLFLGTATSTGLPLTPCLTLSTPYPHRWSNMVPLLHDRDRSSGRSHSPASTASSTAYAGSTYDPEGEWPKNIPCACCRSTVDPDVPEGWKNKRGNTSVLLRKQSAEGSWKNVLVDVGKTFREQAMRFFPTWGVKTIDAVLLTHGRELPFLRGCSNSEC